MRKLVYLVLLFLLIFVSTAFSEEKFGTQVYPGAKYDASVSKSLRETIGVDGFAYRTDDSVEKVAEFYKRQGLILLGRVTPGNALLQTKTGVSVTIQNPWMDMNTGKMFKDTLISIVKK